MSKIHIQLYRSRFTFSYCCFLGFRLAPFFLYHFIRRPYRQSVPALGYKKLPVTLRRRGRDSLYDALFLLLLQCLAKFTQISLYHPSTGQMLFFLSGMLASFDGCLEKRFQTGASLAFEDVLAELAVQERLQILRRYLHLYGAEEPIMNHLRQMFADHYETYIVALKRTQQDLVFEDVFACAHADSGIELCCLMEIAALFNGITLDEQARKDFYLFGMLGKFADDWIDIKRDLREGSPNLFYTLLCQVPDELAAFKKRVAQGKPLKVSWWHQRCPLTYAHYFEYIEQHYQQIQLSHLRLVCDLVVLPVIVGYDYDSPRWK